VTGAVTRKIFNYLLSELRHRELLPVTFKMKKHRGFTHIYRDIKIIFDLFIRTFMEVKQDKDKFVKAVEMHLDPTVKEHLEGRGINEMYLNNKKKTATILFSDIRGFTSFTETHEANDVITILNEYFTETTKIINKHKGRVNKYIGDAVMAVFEEAPKYKDYLDCDQAIIAALDIQTQYRILFRKWKDKIDPSISIGLGIGLARGEVIAGTIGSEERMEYTVIGDTVNFASRLCAKAGDGQVLISDDIYSMVSKFVEVETLSSVEIKGKTGTYSLYSVKTRRMVI
jgi:adenylate cyclase